MSLDKILVVDDDSVVRDMLQALLAVHRIPATCAATLVDASACLAREKFDLMLLDRLLPDGDGLRFLEEVTAQPNHPPVAMMTGDSTIDSAVACMRAGAFDYVLKPFTHSKIEAVLRKAQSLHGQATVNMIAGDPAVDEPTLVARSPSMVRLHQLIERVAPTDATVLITGESGTGKEMIAREFYRLSRRRGRPFIKVNCAAVSETLIESEFFGHERGAFTGATDKREGRFELANNGTLLLDEVSEIPAALQAKLLRVLQEREFERVGGSRTLKVNVRIIATSNRDLLANVEKGDFRQDLYYRLNVFPLHVPPLRERMEDVPALAEHFLLRFAGKHGVKVAGFSESACAAMLAYKWPGNVRELQNTIERAVILSEPGRAVTAAALGLGRDMHATDVESAQCWLNALPIAQVSVREHRPPPSEVISPGRVMPLEQLEKQAILAALRETGGNRTQAADALGISIRTLRNKLHEYREAGDELINGLEPAED